jgi:hypothetical protein
MEAACCRVGDLKSSSLNSPERVKSYISDDCLVLAGPQQCAIELEGWNYEAAHDNDYDDPWADCPVSVSVFVQR